jgi:hypothetical protein
MIEMFSHVQNGLQSDVLSILESVLEPLGHYLCSKPTPSSLNHCAQLAVERKEYTFDEM